MINDRTFKTSIETISAIIDSSLSRKQYTNAEKYITYLFEVIYASYAKGKYDFDGPEDPNDQVEDNFGIRPRHIGFLEYKLFNLLNASISPGQHATFDFLRKHYIKLITKLIDNNHKEAAGRLLHRYPIVITNLLTLGDGFTRTERNWYEHASYSVFETLFAHANINPTEVGTFTSNLLFVIRTIIDYDKIEVFEELMQVFMTHYPLCDIGSSNIYDIERNFELLPELSLALLTLHKDPFTPADVEKSTQQYRELLETQNTQGLSLEIQAHLLDRYKHNSIRLALFTSMVYAFYKKQYHFFTAYLYAHQPADSDTIWASKNFAFSLFDIPKLMQLKDEILEQGILNIGHHGFTIYFYQIVGYYLIKGYHPENLAQTLPVLEETEAGNIEYQLIQIREILHPSYLREIEPDLEMSRERFQEILQAYIGYVSARKNEMELARIKASEIDQSLVEQLKAEFQNSFQHNAIFRLFEGLNIEIDLSQTHYRAKVYGVNNFIQKILFIPNLDVQSGWGDHHGKIAAITENNTILREIIEKATKLTLNESELYNFLAENQAHYDLMFIADYWPRYLREEKFKFQPKHLKPIHSYSESDQFQGSVLERYDLFRLHQTIRPNHILLLNKKNIGTLSFFDTKSIPGNDFLDTFKFALTDLSKLTRAEMQDFIEGTNMEPDKAQRMVVLKMLSSIVFTLVNDFSAVYINLDNSTTPPEASA